tara:strand:+ start:127 stop:678 length:552 start_codon:yes stop_codon:yes gene_type:complete
MSFRKSRNRTNSLTLRGTELTIGSGRANDAGAGFDSAVTAEYLQETNGEIIALYHIDLGVGGIAGNGANKAIGEASGAAYFTRLTPAVNGRVAVIEMFCVEVPTTGEADIDLYFTTNAAKTKGQATGGTQAINAGDWTFMGQFAEAELEADVTNNYLYLSAGGTGTGTYDAGKYVVRVVGYKF